ncbi:hypothetical protein OG288_06480 [Streptomyces tauricus]|uniref:Uncharacterized protein n=1 Tax=Streptomyces tauricus TaxID=68274 RepID=A0ABZ1JA57_9ACTN|nr:hypothetical protein [Streptomyces tauricus]
MDANDHTGPRQWATTSPEHLDQLARGVLTAARDAARQLRRDPPDPAQQTWALGKLAGQTQAMLGPALPDHPPVGAAAQEGFVRTALALAVHVRVHSWAERDLGPAGVPGRDDVLHPGESRTADAFDVLNRLMLPNASAEGWTATLVTDLARGDKTLETAVKVGKYILHPTFLALIDDATRTIGEALHSLNVRRLQELTHSLCRYAGAEPSHSAAEPVVSPAVDVLVPAKQHNLSAQRVRPSVAPLKQPENPGSEPRIWSRRLLCSPSNRRPVDSEPVPAEPVRPSVRQASPEHARDPRSALRSSGVSGPHNSW